MPLDVEPTVGITIRLPEWLYVAVADRAVKERRSKANVIRNVLEGDFERERDRDRWLASRRKSLPPRMFGTDDARQAAEGMNMEDLI
jgi:hypothetical protein